MVDISIIIVNYNTEELVRACIRSIVENTSGLRYEIVVVDNASQSFDVAGFQHEFPKVRLINSRENLGFSKGNNLGIQNSAGKYVVLLNSDTYLQENAFGSMLCYMEANPRVGVLSPKIVYPDGRHQSVAQRFPSLHYLLFELLRLQKIVGRRYAGRVLLGAFFNHKETVSADWVWGTSMMIRRDVIDLLPGGQLDESYFMYWEDVQWCRDISNLGYKIVFYADVEVVHIQGASKGDKRALIEENYRKFLAKNYSPLKISLLRTIQKCLQP